MITGKEDAANNYARGHYTIGKEQIEVWSTVWGRFALLRETKLKCDALLWHCAVGKEKKVFFKAQILEGRKT